MAKRTLKPTLHTVYRNIRVIKQATIKQYLIVANTWQHMQHFRIVDTLLKLPLRPKSVCQSRTPWGHPMLSCLCPPYDKPHSARFLPSTASLLTSPHPCSAVCGVQCAAQQSGWVRIIKNKLTCVPIISTALAACCCPYHIQLAVPRLSCPLLSSPVSLSLSQCRCRRWYVFFMDDHKNWNWCSNRI